MNTAIMTGRIKEASPHARTAGVFYLLTFATGIYGMQVHSRLGLAAEVIAAACYVAVTLLFYFMFKPVNRNLSLLAAVFSLVGCIIGPVGLVVRSLSRINPLVLFGFYCLLIGYLIFRSTFLPRILGVLMAVAGLGWLTFAWPRFASYLSPYNMIPGMVGEGGLTLWLLVFGVNEQRWKEQAGIAEQWRSQHS
jgi:Domain of unknown function (DUF4386)